MLKELNSRAKTPNETTYDLYDELMLLANTQELPHVYPDNSLGLTVATVHRPVTQHHDLLFYRFDHYELPVARITHKGERMEMLTYGIGHSSTRYTISETDVQDKLKVLLEQVKSKPVAQV